jgi:hypothetical protein
MKHQLILAAAAAAAAITLSSCGSGTGSDSTISARPQSMDGIVLNLDGLRLEFIRNRGSGLATNPGDFETGTFIYALSGNQLRQYSNRGGDNSDVRWPDDVTSATYTYQMINETSGILTLDGFAVNDLTITGQFDANNGSFCYFFESDSLGNVITQVQIDMTFESIASDQFVQLTAFSDVRIPGTAAPQYDIVRIPSNARLIGALGGGLIPFNYLPEDDSTRPSRIVPITLNNTTVQFTNGLGNTALDFSIQFVRDAVDTTDPSVEPIEIGTGIMRIDNVPVINAIDYTWQRIPGTDNATLVINNSGTTLDGSYTLSFSGVDFGTYTGVLDGDTVDINDVIGTFFIPAAAVP